MKIRKFFKEDFKQSFREKLKLVIMNRNTYEEKFSVEISPLAVFVFVTISTLILIILTTVLITITPLREYIPGYGSSKQGKKILMLQSKVDSLQQTIVNFDQYRENIQKVFANQDFASDTMAFHSIKPEKIKQNEFAFSKEDSMLMNIDMQYKKKNTHEEIKISKRKINAYPLFFIPFNGVIINKYNLNENQCGLSFKVLDVNELHAIASGNVIYSNKISRDEHVLILQYPENIISIYKFVGESIVQTGSFVRVGQVIGKITDVTKEVYFELWINGKPVNPENYISF